MLETVKELENIQIAFKNAMNACFALEIVMENVKIVLVSEYWINNSCSSTIFIHL